MKLLSKLLNSVLKDPKKGWYAVKQTNQPTNEIERLKFELAN